MRTSPRTSALAVLACTVAAGCSFGESGVPPPLDGLFLPTGMAADPGGGWLYVVNSNSDLRYNAGTVAAVDLTKVAEDRAKRDWPTCPSAGYRPTGPSGIRSCCFDFHDPLTLNCDERGYVPAAATARIGSFGSTLVVGSGDPAGQDRRLFVAVRAEPSVTYLDARVNGSEIELRCGAGGPNPVCGDAHKIRSGTDVLGPFKLPEEPYSMAVDRSLGALYVGHGLYGVSVIDMCAPERPTLVSVAYPVLSGQGEAVNGLLVGQPGNPAGPLYALGRFFSNTAAEVQTLFVRGADLPCGGSAPRPIEVVRGPSFFPSAFYPFGMDIRGLALSADGQRAYVLYRNGRDPRGNDYSRDNPPALVAVDLSKDARGEPLNRAIDVMEVCSGATELHRHDAGRGARLYVVCFESGQVYVVDPELMELSAIINAGRGPTTLVFAPGDPTTAYLGGFADNNISVIDLKPGSATENKVVQRIGFPALRR